MDLRIPYKRGKIELLAVDLECFLYFSHPLFFTVFFVELLSPFSILDNFVNRFTTLLLGHWKKKLGFTISICRFRHSLASLEKKTFSFVTLEGQQNARHKLNVCIDKDPIWQFGLQNVFLVVVAFSAELKKVLSQSKWTENHWESISVTLFLTLSDVDNSDIFTRIEYIRYFYINKKNPAEPFFDQESHCRLVF